jgi:hypothetical protein
MMAQIKKRSPSPNDDNGAGIAALLAGSVRRGRFRNAAGVVARGRAGAAGSASASADRTGREVRP